MPGMKTVGRKTAASTRAMATTGPATSSIACERRLLGRHALLDVALHRLDHDDGVVHHQADGHHHPHQGNGVDGKAEEREKGEGADERHRHGEDRE